MQKHKKSYCGVLNCFNNSVSHPEMSYFRLPKDPQRAAMWLKIIHREKSKVKKILVCEMHFESRYVNVNESRKRLVATAVPTLLLPDTVNFEYTPDYDDIALLNRSVATQTDTTSDTDTIADIEITSDIDTKPDFYDHSATIHLKHNISHEPDVEPDCKKIKYENLNETNILLNVECISEDDSSINVSKILQLYNVMTEKCEGEVYTEDFKFFALNLYFTSPKAYKVLQNTLKLPTISMLYRLCIPTSPEINENVMKALKIRINNMTNDQKQCAVCVGTIALRPHLDYDKSKDKVIGFHEVEGVQILEPAKFLFVVMVRGLFDDWKQAISYSLVAQYQSYKDVKTQLDKIFQRIFDIGLHVRVFITDMESEFMSVTTEKKITPEKPYFFVNNKKIYYMYDPPHIIRAVRDSLQNNDIHIDEAIVKWKYISQFYDIENSRLLKFAPKLTFYHLRPNIFEKVRVSLAAQLFSNTTAAGISMLIDMKLLDDSAKDTVQWILKLNKLFDMLNFSSFADDSKTFKGEQWQVDYLRETMSLLDNIRIIGHGKGVDVTAKSKFIKGYKTTINAILLLHEHFKLENRKFLRPRFTRDCLDTFTEKVRAKYGVDPTCKSIMSIIKSLPIFTIFLWTTRKKNSNDMNEFLIAANEISNVQIYEVLTKSNLPERQRDLVTSVNYTTLELPKKDALPYLASYLLHEGFQRHRDCDVMRNYVYENYKKMGNKCVYYKNDSDNGSNAVSAPNDFVRFIFLLESTIKSYFESQIVKNPIVASLIRSVEDVDFVVPCVCFPLGFIKELYVRCRFHVILNYNNREFRTCKKCRKSVTVNNI